MSRSGRVWLVIFVLGGISGLTWLRADAEDQAEKPADLKEADQEKQYAVAFLKLQLAKQKKAVALNKRVTNAISQTDMAILARNVELGRQLVESAARGESAGRKSVYLRFAENNVAAAESALATATVARSKSRLAVSDVDLEILQVQAEVARINLAAGETALADDTVAELRWKIGILYEEIIRLRDEVKQLRRRR